MTTKLILRWDIQSGAESEYFEFMVSEFIPGMKRLGINDPGVWYTAYGETEEHMHFILRSKDWSRLKDGLEDLVSNFSQKITAATGGFQF